MKVEHRRRILGWILLALVLHMASPCHGLAPIPSANHEVPTTESPTISSSHFLLGSDGWDVLGKGVKTEICHMSLCVEDFGDSVWYRRAPDGFLGNVSNAFGGILTMEMGFFEINRAGRPGFQEEEGMRFDVILENHKHNVRIGVHELFSAGSFSANFEIPLSEAGGWLHITDGKKATNKDIVKVLSSLANLLIRGGHYAGPEHTYMRRVLMQGPPPTTSQRKSAEGISSTDSHAEPAVSIPAEKQAGESALQRALRERSLALERPQVVIHIGGDNHMRNSGAPPEFQVVSHTGKQQQLVPEGGDQREQKPKQEQGQQQQPHQQTPKQRMGNLAHSQHEAQNEAQHNTRRHAHALPCFDDGSHLPVTKLIRSAQASKSQLIACLSSRDGAFSVSLDELSFVSAQAGSTTQVARLDRIHGVNISEDDGYVVVSTKDDGVVIKGCKMKSFDMDELAAFFETVQDLVDAHQPL
jgi:hypothetical protein